MAWLIVLVLMGIILALFLLWRLFDLFKGDGIWKRDLKDPELDVARTAPDERARRCGEVAE